jgi:hypothetical protein
VTFSDVPLPNGAQRLVAYLPTLAAVTVVAFDLWIWRWPVIGSWTHRPRLQGDWTVSIAPRADSKIPGGTAEKRFATATIDQSFWTIGVTLETEESVSATLSATLERITARSSVSRLSYTYLNTPDAAVRPSSPTHLGAVQVLVRGKYPRELRGTYWTDRLTAGDIRFSRT